MPAHQLRKGTVWRRPVLAEVPVFVRSFSVRHLAYELVDELRQRGMAAFVVPSDRTIGMWDVEVLGGAAVLARLIAEEFSRDGSTARRSTLT